MKTSSMDTIPHQPGMPAAPGWINKVPEVTLGFWIIKLLSTTVGETGADYLAVGAGLGKAPTIGLMATPRAQS